MEFQRGILSKVNNEWLVEPTGSQGSGVLSSMSEANCFIVLSSEQGLVEKGENGICAIYGGSCVHKL
jgi:molybdopterin molybdotransferase